MTDYELKKIQWDLEIKLFLPSNTLVTFLGEDKNEYYENESFKKIRTYLGIDINVNNWYNRCNQIAFGKKHLQKIELYYSEDEQSYILLDNYADPYDQLGLIGLGIKTTAKLGHEIRILTRKLNDESPYNINYCEGSSAIFKYYPIDEKTKRKYIEPQKSDYLEGKQIEIIKSR